MWRTTSLLISFNAESQRDLLDDSETIRKLPSEAQRCGYVDSETAQAIITVAGVSQKGRRLGRWLAWEVPGHYCRRRTRTAFAECGTGRCSECW